MHMGPWKSLCRVSEVTFTSDGPDVNAIQRHACMLTNHFWQGACRMSGSVNRPPFYPLLLISKRAEKQKQIKVLKFSLIALTMLSLEHKMLFTKVTVSDVTTFVANF